MRSMPVGEQPINAFLSPGSPLAALEQIQMVQKWPMEYCQRVPGGLILP